MRRPLKPFVTEYKSTARRPKDAFDLQLPADNAPDSGPGPARFAEPPRNVPPPSEDSYEAAMRAADALFAPAPKPAPTPAQPPAGASALAPSATPMPPERGSGRILQAIVDEAEDPFAALEAEHAPKRRGRKPGSKNKPKVAAIAAFAAPVEERPTKAKVKAPVRQAEPPLPVAAAIPGLSATRERGERFAWVRTSLRPGERWKRRLPKVAW